MMTLILFLFATKKNHNWKYLARCVDASIKGEADFEHS